MLCDTMANREMLVERVPHVGFPCAICFVMTRLSRNKRSKSINKVNDLGFFFQADAVYKRIIHHRRIVTCPKSRPNF